MKEKMIRYISYRELSSTFDSSCNNCRKKISHDTYFYRSSDTNNYCCACMEKIIREHIEYLELTLQKVCKSKLINIVERGKDD